MRQGNLRWSVVLWSLAVVWSLGLADWGGAVAVVDGADAGDAGSLVGALADDCPLDRGQHRTGAHKDAHVDDEGRRVPADVTESLLAELHGALDDEPGFRDVHFVLHGAPRFVAWFDADAALPEVSHLEAPYPVTAEAVDPALARSGRSDTGAEPPLVPGPCGNNRPGGVMMGCTMSFQLRDESGRLYVATAGHCIPHLGWAFSFGEAVFKRANGIGDDFGLVLVDPVVAQGFEPAMCHWGGPTGTATTGGLGDVVRLYGHGMVVGELEATRARSGVLHSVGATSFTYVGPVMAFDSGAPVRTDAGPALGVHTHGLASVGPVTLPTSTPTLKWGTRMDAGIAMAEAELGVDLTLLTAPVA